jgi:chaperonin cofactor prefoldin
MLKADLQQALEKLESQEQTIQRQAEPQTREEAEALESQLQEALNEVSTIKRRLNEGGQ